MSKKQLSDEQYYITQKQGTEPPYSGKYVFNKEKGISGLYEVNWKIRRAE